VGGKRRKKKKRIAQGQHTRVTGKRPVVVEKKRGDVPDTEKGEWKVRLGTGGKKKRGLPLKISGKRKLPPIGTGGRVREKKASSPLETSPLRKTPVADSSPLRGDVTIGGHQKGEKERGKGEIYLENEKRSDSYDYWEKRK